MMKLIYRWKNLEYIRELIAEHELELFEKQFKAYVPQHLKDSSKWMIKL